MTIAKQFVLILGIIAAFAIGWLLLTTLNSGLSAVNDGLDTVSGNPEYRDQP